jgi:hypothetical protein
MASSSLQGCAADGVPEDLGTPKALDSGFRRNDEAGRIAGARTQRRASQYLRVFEESPCRSSAPQFFLARTTDASLVLQSLTSAQTVPIVRHRRVGYDTSHRSRGFRPPFDA